MGSILHRWEDSRGLADVVLQHPEEVSAGTLSAAQKCLCFKLGLYQSVLLETWSLYPSLPFPCWWKVEMWLFSSSCGRWSTPLSLRCSGAGCSSYTIVIAALLHPCRPPYPLQWGVPPLWCHLHTSRCRVGGSPQGCQWGEGETDKEQFMKHL